MTELTELPSAGTGPPLAVVTGVDGADADGVGLASAVEPVDGDAVVGELVAAAVVGDAGLGGSVESAVVGGATRGGLADEPWPTVDDAHPAHKPRTANAATRPRPATPPYMNRWTGCQTNRSNGTGETRRVTHRRGRRVSRLSQ